MSAHIPVASQPSKIYLPWRGRCYVPERPARQLVIVRSLAEAIAVSRPVQRREQACNAQRTHQPTHPRGITALLRDYRLVELAVPADAPGVVSVPAVIRQESPPALGSERFVEQLTEREREVLDLLAAGLSNREIAATLVLTLGTVKWHTHNLYGKLGVARRTQAIARARLLGLLTTSDT